MLARHLAHMSKPATDVGRVNLANQGNLTLLFEIGSRNPVPFQRLIAMIATIVVL